jgi:hypothetical protein
MPRLLIRQFTNQLVTRQLYGREQKRWTSAHFSAFALMMVGARKRNAVWSITASACLPTERTDTKSEVATLVLKKGQLIR